MNLRRAVPVLLFLGLALQAHAGPEQAASMAAEAFKADVGAASFKLIPDLGRLGALGSEEDQLVALLDDPSPEVRAAAAKSLNDYALSSYKAEKKLLEVVDRRDEEESVKREAIKSLAWAAQHSNTRKKILEVATDNRQTPTLRAISFKSLYVVSHEYDVRRAMQETVKDSREELAVREGAAWVLWSDSLNDSRSKNALLDVATDRDEPASLRAEAVKSLYLAMQFRDVKDRIEDMARTEGLAESLRVPAVLCLHAVNQDWGIERLLKDLSQGSQSKAVRTAAVKAMSRGLNLELVRTFHLSHYMGRFIDPLEDQ